MEASLLKRLRHPNILPFYGMCQQGSDIYLVSHYAPFDVLQYWAAQPLSPNYLSQSVIPLAIQLARVSVHLCPES